MDVEDLENGEGQDVAALAGGEVVPLRCALESDLEGSLASEDADDGLQMVIISSVYHEEDSKRR